MTEIKPSDALIKIAKDTLRFKHPKEDPEQTLKEIMYTMCDYAGKERIDAAIAEALKDYTPSSEFYMGRSQQ